MFRMLTFATPPSNYKLGGTRSCASNGSAASAFDAPKSRSACGLRLIENVTVPSTI